MRQTLPEVFHIGDALVQDSPLRPQLLDLHLKQPDVLHPLVVLGLALVQNGLLDLDLLVQQCQLVVPPHQMTSQNVPLANYLRNENDIKKNEFNETFVSKMSKHKPLKAEADWADMA